MRNGKLQNNDENKTTKPLSLSKRVAVLSLLTGLGLITFLIEGLLPPLFFPGAKIGLSNIFSLAALILFSPADAFLVVAARTLLGAMFAGNFSSVIYSFSGGIVSTAVSSVLICAVYPKISLMPISIVSALAHNLTQCLAFVAISGTALMFGYMPYLALLAVPAGAAVGALTLLIFKGVPHTIFVKFGR